jgi:hypothetical protein
MAEALTFNQLTVGSIPPPPTTIAPLAQQVEQLTRNEQAGVRVTQGAPRFKCAKYLDQIPNDDCGKVARHYCDD